MITVTFIPNRLVSGAVDLLVYSHTVSSTELCEKQKTFIGSDGSVGGKTLVIREVRGK